MQAFGHHLFGIRRLGQKRLTPRNKKELLLLPPFIGV